MALADTCLQFEPCDRPEFRDIVSALASIVDEDGEAAAHEQEQEEQVQQDLGIDIDADSKPPGRSASAGRDEAEDAGCAGGMPGAGAAQGGQLQEKCVRVEGERAGGSAELGGDNPRM